MTMPQTQGRYEPQVHKISRVSTATEDDGINAFLLDLNRRHKAGELLSLRVTALDKNGDVLEYDSAKIE